jgi:hypothetical protein
MLLWFYRFNILNFIYNIVMNSKILKKEQDELQEKLHRIKLMADGDIIDFINFKNKNKKYIVYGIIVILCLAIPLMILKVNKIFGTKGQIGGGTIIVAGHTINLFLYQAISVCLVIFIVIGLLSLKKISLYCFGCSKGDWWYKCKSNTGYGSISCKSFQTTHNIFIVLVNNVYEVVEKTVELSDVVQDTILEITGALNNFAGTIRSIFKVPEFEVPRITNFPRISCGFRIPIIGKHIDICHPVQVAIHTALTTMNHSLTFLQTLIDGLRNGMNTVVNFIIQMLGQIISNFIKVFDTLVIPIKESMKIVGILKEQLMNIYNIIADIGIINVILYNLLLFANRIVSLVVMDNIPNDFTIKSVNDSKIGFLLSIVTIMFIIFIIFPIIGGCYLGIKGLIAILMIPLNVVLGIFNSITGLFSNNNE